MGNARSSLQPFPINNIPHRRRQCGWNFTYFRQYQPRYEGAMEGGVLAPYLAALSAPLAVALLANSKSDEGYRKTFKR